MTPDIEPTYRGRMPSLAIKTIISREKEQALIRGHYRATEEEFHLNSVLITVDVIYERSWSNCNSPTMIGT